MGTFVPAALREHGVKGVMYDRSFVGTVLALIGQHCPDVSSWYWLSGRFLDLKSLYTF